jgi:putative intracellular protease/amidase
MLGHVGCTVILQLDEIGLASSNGGHAMARIAIVLLDQFADWEGAQLAAAAHSDLGDQVRWLSPSGHVVRSMGGLSARVDGAVEDFEPEHADALVFIGSPRWQTDDSPVLTPTARMAADAGLIIGGICGATLQLARAGLLNDRSHTSNSLAFLRQYAAGYHGEALYRDVPQAVSDGRVITASGLAPSTFAGEVLRALHPDKLDYVNNDLAQFAREHVGR